MSTLQHHFIKYMIAGQIQREWVFLADGTYVPDRLGGNLIYALCGLALWDTRIGILSRIGDDIPEHHQIWLQKNAIIDGLLYSKNMRIKCQFFDYETTKGTAPESMPFNKYSRKRIPFPRELLGLKLEDSDRDYTFQNSKKEYPCISEIPLNYQFPSVVLIEQMPVIDQLTIPMAVHRYSSPYMILTPSPSIMSSSGYKTIPALCSGINCILVNEVDLRTLFSTKSNDLIEKAEALSSLRVEIILIKLLNGQYLSYDSASKTCKLIPSYPTPCIDTTGIESAFNGGYMAGMQLSYDPVEAAIYGSISASVCRENYCAVKMLQTHKDLILNRVESLRTQVKDFKKTDLS